MALASTAATTLSSNSQRARDIVGGVSGGQVFSGMRTIPLAGEGEQLVENMYLETGRYRKMLGEANFITTAIGAEVLYVFPYQKSDGTWQLLHLSLTGGKYKMRAVNAAGSESTPTGGGGDVEFTSAVFDFVQIGTTGVIINNSATTQCYTWDGAALTALSNVAASPIFCTKDGTRLVVGYASAPTGYNSNVIFSRADFASAGDFESGTGVNAEGSYNTTLKAKDAIEGNTGIIIYGDIGIEAHWVRTNDASDAVSSKTKIEAFSSTSVGVSTAHRAVGGKQFVYHVNATGLYKMNPFSGEAINLVENAGTLRRYWEDLTLDNTKITYSPKEGAIIVSLTITGNTNDRLMCYYEESETIVFKTRVYARGLAVIDNQLYAGEEAGKITKVFSSGTYSDRDDSAIITQIITEWRAPLSAHIEKRMLKAGVVCALDEDSRADISFYTNGSEDAVASTSITLSGTVSGGETTEQVGIYLMGIGAEEDTEDISGSLVRASNRQITTGIFLTYAMGVREESVEDFVLDSLFVDWLTYGKDSVSTTFARHLFDFTA